MPVKQLLLVLTWNENIHPPPPKKILDTLVTPLPLVNKTACFLPCERKRKLGFSLANIPDKQSLGRRILHGTAAKAHGIREVYYCAFTKGFDRNKELLSFCHTYQLMVIVLNIDDRENEQGWIKLARGPWHKH